MSTRYEWTSSTLNKQLIAEAVMAARMYVVSRHLGNNPSPAPAPAPEDSTSVEPAGGWHR